MRGENTSKSDIDILIDFNAGQETYLNYMDACSILRSPSHGDPFQVSLYASADKKFIACPAIPKQSGSRGLCDFLVKPLTPLGSAATAGTQE